MSVAEKTMKYLLLLGEGIMLTMTYPLLNFATRRSSFAFVKGFSTITTTGSTSRAISRTRASYYQSSFFGRSRTFLIPQQTQTETRKYSGTALCMKLQTAIVGLPNVGKSTLFNALTESQGAEAANYPFCTIEPNTG